MVFDVLFDGANPLLPGKGMSRSDTLAQIVDRLLDLFYGELLIVLGDELVVDSGLRHVHRLAVAPSLLQG